ncbi:phage tail domain-containing protein, partial [Ruthenibacterium lactatiformans]
MLTFEYITANNAVSFSEDSDFWITGIDGLSSNEINISETQGVNQIGSTRSSQSVRPRDLTVTGVLFGNLKENRRTLLSCVSPMIPAHFFIHEDGESWYLEGTPKRTPVMEETAEIQQFQFILHCPYPYWRTADDANTLLAGIKALFRFPFYTGGKWYISKYEASAFKRVLNDGDVAIDLTVELKAMAQVQAPEVLLVETGSMLRITKTLQAGESFTISTVYGSKRVIYRHADGV